MTSPFILIIFGVTGDLTHRKLMPALYKLVATGEIGPDLFIVGVSRQKLTNDQFAESMAAAVRDSVGDKFDLKVWKTILKGLSFQSGYFEEPELYGNLVKLLESYDDQMKACVPRFFYLATPPELYEVILKNLDASKLDEGCGPAFVKTPAGEQGMRKFTRLLIEKPFGRNITASRNLEKLLSTIFVEHQIFRIDHYLGKETVQNLLAFRFANGIFEPTWNKDFVDHVQIALLEGEGVGSRGSFYDGVGALRDVFQNHMLQMLALTAMDQPRAFDSVSLRDMRSKAIKDIDLTSPIAVRGQYEGYRKEAGVNPNSQTETFVAVKLMLGNDRWRGVPFYLRTGKKLGATVTEISVHFKKPKVCYGDLCLFDEKKVLRNVLSIKIQPDESVKLRVMVKKPGLGMNLKDTEMEFSYGRAFPNLAAPEAYEKLFLDAIRGDQTLFAMSDGIEASWEIVTKIMEKWQTEKELEIYPDGSTGPKVAEKLIGEDGRRWFLI